MENIYTLFAAIFVMVAVLIGFSLTVYFILEGMFSFRKRKHPDPLDEGVKSTYERALL